MKKVMIVCDKAKQREYESILKMLAEIFQEKGFQVKTIIFGEAGKPDHVYFAEMQEYDGDYICSLDMAGFQIPYWNVPATISFTVSRCIL